MIWTAVIVKTTFRNILFLNTQMRNLAIGYSVVEPFAIRSVAESKMILKLIGPRSEHDSFEVKSQQFFVCLFVCVCV